MKTRRRSSQWFNRRTFENGVVTGSCSCCFRVFPNEITESSTLLLAAPRSADVFAPLAAGAHSDLKRIVAYLSVTSRRRKKQKEKGLVTATPARLFARLGVPRPLRYDPTSAKRHLTGGVSRGSSRLDHADPAVLRVLLVGGSPEERPRPARQIGDFGGWMQRPLSFALNERRHFSSLGLPGLGSTWFFISRRFLLLLGLSRHHPLPGHPASFTGHRWLVLAFSLQTNYSNVSRARLQAALQRGPLHGRKWFLQRETKAAAATSGHSE